MHQSSSESSIDKNRFPSVINLFAISDDRNNCLQSYEEEHINMEMKSLKSDENNVEISTLYTIDERNLSAFKTSGFEGRCSDYNKVTQHSHHSDSESESSIEHSGQDRMSTTSTSTSSDDGELKTLKSKSKIEIYTYKPGNQSEHQAIFRKEMPEDVCSLKTHPNCPSSPSMWSSSTSGKFGNISARRVMIRGSMSQDVSQYRHSNVGNRMIAGTVPHGFRLNSQAADSGISNTSPDTLSSTEFYQRNIEDFRIISKCNRLIGNIPQQGSNFPPQSILKHRRRHIPGQENSVSSFRSFISNLVSIIYISLLSTIVLVLSIADHRHIPGSRLMLEIIHIILYSISILFLTIFNLSDCKGQSRKYPFSKVTAERNPDMEFDHCLILSNPSSFEVQEKSNLENAESVDLHGNKRTSEVIINMTVSKMKLLSETSRDMFEGLFKISILILGIISMVKDCFELSAQIEAGQFNFPNAKRCTSALIISRTFLSLLFTSIQIYFIFLDSKTILSRVNQKIILGIVHLTATNFSSLIYNVISWKITFRNANNIYPHSAITYTTKPFLFHGLYMITSPDSSFNISLCADSAWRRQLTTVSEEYLYPFSTQYRMLSIVVYIVLLWSVDQIQYSIRPNIPNLTSKHFKQSSDNNTQLRPMYCRVNCRNSNRGFFIGLFSLLLSIISILLLLIFSNNVSLKVVGMNISYCIEMLLTSITTFVLVGTLYQIRDVSLISYNQNNNKIEAANRFLILFSLFGGIYFYNICCIFSWSSNVNAPSAPYVMISSLCTIINGTLQTIFIMLAMARTYNSDPLPIIKPRKGFISFILMNNIALWCLAIFTELQQQSTTYIPSSIFSIEGWMIIKRISIPLILMFRLDSVISLAVIWRFI